MLQHAAPSCDGLNFSAPKIPLCTRPPGTARVYLRLSLLFLLALLAMLQHASPSCAGLNVSASKIPLCTRAPGTGRVYLPLQLLFLLALGQSKQPLHPRQRDTPVCPHVAHVYARLSLSSVETDRTPAVWSPFSRARKREKKKSERKDS
jgi:hypothetical protein